MVKSVGKRQLTLFACPGSVRQKLVDSKNRVHYVPVDDAVISSITRKKNVNKADNVCIKCGATFSNEQGLGGHMIHCKHYDLLSVPPSRSQGCTRGLSIVHNASTITAPSSRRCKSTVPQESKPDKRRGNKGSLRRRRYSMQEKFDVMEQCDETIASDLFPTIHTPTQYFNYYYRNPDICHKWVSQYGKWSKPAYREKVVGIILGNNFAARGKFTRSPYHQLESLLYEEILNKRKNGHRISNTFIRIRALSLFQQLKDESVPGYQDLKFKASNGWRSNFIKRRKLKYRRRKSGKRFSANKHVQTYQNFLQCLRFKLLRPIDDTVQSDALWGRFPPSHRYNMDQVPLPFVVSQDFTFTVENDTNIHITCPSESLRKRQWTMHVVTNAGDGEKRHAWVDLVTRGAGKRIKQAETQRYHPGVDMFWQKNAWVDGEVMKKLAHKFVREKLDKHGDDWVILYADNLSAHLLPEVKSIFGTNHVLVVYFPPNMTEMVQPIDAGYGRSLRCAIGRELDAWLMDAANLLKWESKMSAMERRILVTHLVARAQEYMMQPEIDSQRISCFERTGCLITTQVCPERDKKISPQGLTVPFVIPVLPPVGTEDETEVTPEPREDVEELQNIAELFNEDVEDAELVLDNDISHDALQEDEV